jgi:hypothetical protein
MKAFNCIYTTSFKRQLFYSWFWEECIIGANLHHLSCKKRDANKWFPLNYMIFELWENAIMKDGTCEVIMTIGSLFDRCACDICVCVLGKKIQ